MTLLSTLLFLFVLIFGNVPAAGGLRISVEPLPWPYCGAYYPGHVIIDSNVEEKCPTGVPEIETVPWVLVHEVCHHLHQYPHLPADHPLWHGRAHQDCMVHYYAVYRQAQPRLEVIELQ